MVKNVGNKVLNWKLAYEPGDEWDILWSDRMITHDNLKRLKPHQRINHFPGMYQLARKSLLSRNLMRLRNRFPKEYNFFPQT